MKKTVIEGNGEMKSALCVDENGQYGGIKRNKSGVMKSVRMNWYTLYTQPNKDIIGTISRGEKKLKIRGDETEFTVVDKNPHPINFASLSTGRGNMTKRAPES